MFVECGRVEVKVFEVALVLLAINVVSIGKDQVTVDQEGSSIETYSSRSVGVLQKTNA